MFCSFVKQRFFHASSFSINLVLGLSDLIVVFVAPGTPVFNSIRWGMVLLSILNKYLIDFNINKIPIFLIDDSSEQEIMQLQHKSLKNISHGAIGFTCLAAASSYAPTPVSYFAPLTFLGSGLSSYIAQRTNRDRHHAEQGFIQADQDESQGCLNRICRNIRP